MKTVNLLTLALLLAAAGMTARAAEVEPLEMQRAMRRAGLSKQQIRRIGELSLQADRQKLDIQKDLDLARLRLQQLLDADRPDRQAIMQQVEKVGRLETRLRQNRIDLLLDIRALMTAEQWRQLELFHFLRRQAGSGRRRP